MSSRQQAAAPKIQRCAIYTRKSTDHNLDLAFNSLDAQREACEAYIKSQAHEGWRLAAGQYDDGAFSGASLDRPALQALLGEVQFGRIDIIVVYKVDRLTRSLADFAKLVELFDEHQVSFVSVTQSFNTTSSMGRLTLNVLLSFAQFEREVIGERVRDKIAASKRKGLWVGGPIPLGYCSVDKKLQVVPAEAETVRLIFSTYLELGSVQKLAAWLDARNIRPKPRLLSNGGMIQTGRFMVGPLAHLLKNRFYIGEVAYRGEIHKGEQEAIVDRELFDAVQVRMQQQSVARKTRRDASPSILTGRIFDDAGHAMSPSHSNKRGVRYRYYVSQALTQGEKDRAGSVARVPAPDVEEAVCRALRQRHPDLSNFDDRAIVDQCVERVVATKANLRISVISGERAEGDGSETDRHPQPDTIMVPFIIHRPARKGYLHQPQSEFTMTAEARDILIKAIARARRWLDEILSGAANSFDEIAAREGLVERHIRFLMPLAFVAPRVIEAIADGAAPADLTVSRLARGLPNRWADQVEMVLGR